MAAPDGLLPTGSQDLDHILGGGLQPGSTIVIAGPPGSGKTVLAQQICFTNATPEAPALYYTTWSEPHPKMLRNLSAFDFFDEQAIGSRLDILNLPSIMEGEDAGLEAVTGELLRASLQRTPSVIVIDSSKALHAMVSGEGLRRAFYDLSSRIGHTGSVLVLVGEYTAAEIDHEPEFAVADGIIQLANQPDRLIDRRWLRVTKMRGARIVPGRHSLTIGGDGVRAFPRLETMLPDQPPRATGRAAFLDRGLNAMTGGGLPRGDATLLLGPGGIGKTVLTLEFVTAGLRAGEPALYISFQESPEELAQKAASLGWNEFGEALEDGRLVVEHVRPVDLDLDRVGVLIRNRIERQRPRRVVLDSIAELDLGAREPDRYLSYLYAAVNLVGGHGATGIFTQEIATLGPEAPGAALSFVFQNVLVMRFVEHGSEFLRAITAFKMRESVHDLDLTEFEIGPAGFRTSGKVAGVSGLLGWTALRKEG